MVSQKRIGKQISNPVLLLLGMTLLIAATQSQGVAPPPPPPPVRTQNSFNTTYVQGKDRVDDLKPSNLLLLPQTQNTYTNYLPKAVTTSMSWSQALLVKMAQSVLALSSSVTPFLSGTVAASPALVNPTSIFAATVKTWFDSYYTTTAPNTFTASKQLGRVPDFIQAAYQLYTQNTQIALSDLQNVNTIMTADEDMALKNVNFIIGNGPDIVTRYTDQLTTNKVITDLIPLITTLSNTYPAKIKSSDDNMNAVIIRAQALVKLIQVPVGPGKLNPVVVTLLTTFDDLPRQLNFTRTNVDAFIKTVQKRNANVATRYESDYAANCNPSKDFLVSTTNYYTQFKANFLANHQTVLSIQSSRINGSITSLKSTFNDVFGRLVDNINRLQVILDGHATKVDAIVTKYVGNAGLSVTCKSAYDALTAYMKIFDVAVVGMTKINQEIITPTYGVTMFALRDILTKSQVTLQSISTCFNGNDFTMTINIPLDFNNLQQISTSDIFAYNPFVKINFPPLPVSWIPKLDDGVDNSPLGSLMTVVADPVFQTTSPNHPDYTALSTFKFPSFFMLPSIYDPDVVMKNSVQVAFPCNYAVYSFGLAYPNLFLTAQPIIQVNIRFPSMPDPIVIPFNPLVVQLAGLTGSKDNGFNNFVSSVNINADQNGLQVKIMVVDNPQFQAMIRSGRSPSIFLTVAPQAV